MHLLEIRNNIIRLLLFAFIPFLAKSCSDSSKPVAPLAKVVPLKILDSTVSGEQIDMKFKLLAGEAPQMLVSNHLGAAIVDWNMSGDSLIYKWPEHYTTKAGVSHWMLFSGSTPIVSGNILIKPSNTPSRGLEAYVGPKNLIAGTGDSNMIITLPTDEFDNPMIRGSRVLIESQHKNYFLKSQAETENLIAWSKIEAPETIGKIIIGAKSRGVSSKEFTVEVLPAKASAFSFDITRDHDYADGNQIVELTTSVIRDQQGNPVMDGTLVQFVLKTDGTWSGNTSATTINGIATARLLHPQIPSTWSIQGFVAGVAESNAKEIQFNAAISEIPVTIDRTNGNIVAGPILSFMGQKIPDGFFVSFEFRDHDGTLHYHSVKETRRGRAILNYRNTPVKSDTYLLNIISGGIKINKEIYIDDRALQ